VYLAFRSPGVALWRVTRATGVGLARHWLFVAAFGLGVLARLLTMLGFPPAIWFGGDSTSYLSTALRLAPGTSRLSGYGLELALLRPFHSFAVVTGVQHLQGLAVAVMIYALLRHYRLPAWAATLAALPVLLYAYQLELEHEILASATFGFLIMVAITLTVWWPAGHPPWPAIAAGGFLGAAATLWPVGLPMLVVLLAYLALRRAGWRALTGAALAGAVPLAGYLLWFHHAHGHYAFSYSDGIFLWSRTMTFADCEVIQPPASERRLCPPPDATRPAASRFLWEPDTPLSHVPGNKFSRSKNALALDFARRAIAAQPRAYATSVLHDFSLTFWWDNPEHPSPGAFARYKFARATHHWISPGYVTAPGHTVASDQLDYGGEAGTRVVKPFAGWLRKYQRFGYLPGTLLGVVLLIGLGGVIRHCRRTEIRRLSGWGGPGLLPWFASLTLLLVPVMTADFSVRYSLLAMPVICLAAALAFARPEPAGRTPADTSTPAAPIRPDCGDMPEDTPYPGQAHDQQSSPNRLREPSSQARAWVDAVG
jgi:hypothetical protein